MAAKKKKLCAECKEVRDGNLYPRHLVHPETRKPDVWDTSGRAVCPTCGTMWHRERNSARIVE